MTTNTRKEILKAMELLSDRYPESRFGQLVMCIANEVPESSADALWDLEDRDFLEALRQHLSESAARP
jgi:hypothetical protein